MNGEQDRTDPTSSDPAPETPASPVVSDHSRAAALRAGPTPVPRKFIFWIIIVFAVLGLGGVLGDKLIGNGLASSPAALAENTGGENGVPTGSSTTFVPTSPTPVTGPSLSAPLSAFVGLDSIGHALAPAIDLTDQSGHPWSLSSARGQILVVTFANAECNDSCAVLANEIADAEVDLGAEAKHVTFVVVNTDPLETSITPTPPLLSETPLHTLSNVVYLSGGITRLSAIWSDYGVQVAVQSATRTVTHNDIMYFIDTTGHTRYRITPFANEGANGVFTLSAQDTRKFAHGIVSVISKLEGSA